MAAQQCPGVQVVGVDGDQAILRIARGKLGFTKVDVVNPEVINPDISAPDIANHDSDDRGIHFDRGLATALPYTDASFDRVFSTLFFHHLGNTDKHAALREAYRVLAPGAELHIADWGRPAGQPAYAHAVLLCSNAGRFCQYPRPRRGRANGIYWLGRF